MGHYFPQQRLTDSAKNKNDKQWAKNVIDALDAYRFTSFNGSDDRVRKKINYNLFNGKLDPVDFEYVTRPYGQDLGDLPAELRNYDITSPKLRVLFGEEIKRPFNFRVTTVNPEAVSLREKEKEKMLKRYLMERIQMSIQQEMQKESTRIAGMPAEEQQQAVEQITQEMTPSDIETYMKRGYRSNQEITGQNLLNFLMKRERVRDKFNKGWRHALIAGEEVYWVGIVNGEPKLQVVNPLYFQYDKDPDIEYIQDGQWAKYEMRMTPGSVIDTFGEYLTAKQIGEMYDNNFSDPNSKQMGWEGALDQDIFDNYIDFDWSSSDGDSHKWIRVVHVEWRSLRKIGFLKYMDLNGEMQETIVNDKYRKDEQKGDISIEWQWVPEIWEGTKIGNEIYVNMRPKPNQHRDIDDMTTCKLGFYGLSYNNLNAESVSMVDRIKPYQYLYNIMMYRLELDIASDKGKKFLADINQIPSSMGLDMNKWLYYFDAMGIAWVNPQEEGKRNQQSGFNQWQTLDLSMGQTIQQKVQMLEYLENRAGDVAGVTKQREGQIGASELATNARQAVVQSSHITEEWFYAHNILKREVLTGLLEASKIAYANEPKKIQYVLDDMSISTILLDEKFSEASYGIFLSDSARDQETMEILKQLTHAALQNQQADLSDVVKMLTTDSPEEIKVLLEAAEEKKREQALQQQREQIESQKEMQDKQLAQEQEKQEFEKYKTDTNNETKIVVAEIGAHSREDNDKNNNQVPDDLEVQRLQTETQVNNQKASIEERKLAVKEKEISSKERIEKEKVRSQKAKDKSKK
jgi:hypothetical protein